MKLRALTGFRSLGSAKRYGDSRHNQRVLGRFVIARFKSRERGGN